MILCVRVRVGVCVSAVSQNRAADQRRVVEALHVELGSVLERGGKKRVREREINNLLITLRMMHQNGKLTNQAKNTAKKLN